MNTAQYLTRIGVSLDPDISHDFALLQELQRSHLLSVPFETFDIAHNEPIILDHPSFYTKIVDLDQQYLVDVEYGGFCRVPLPMASDPRSGPDGTYKIAPADGTDHYFALYLTNDEWTPTYRFTTVERELTDFSEMCEYQQTSPESPFTGRTVCTIATSTGRVTLSDDTLTVTENGQKRTEQISSKYERARILSDNFGLSI